ncbi:hypothetical protein HDU91_005024 [Kappamyces sp. JEL0680]|nr:hypothetical protein HDU91_005024 [Kappamyces sp. JEL0680]
MSALIAQSDPATDALSSWRTVGDPSSIHRLVLNYANISLLHQASADLGEPKFNVDASPYTGPWGRPQNDGPALRVLALYKYLLKFGMEDVAKDWYKAELPAMSLIKRDLEYICQRWQDKNYDLWEVRCALADAVQEVEGHHFYTRMVQYAALKVGAAIATCFQDPAAADYYLSVAQLLEQEMAMFWDASRQFIWATVDPSDDHGKASGLDAAVLLACLHTQDFPHPAFGCGSDAVLLTVVKLVSAFQLEFPINWLSNNPLLGRYPEDVYNGTGMSLGNPWILTTHALAQLLYTLANTHSRAATTTLSPASRLFYHRFAPDRAFLVGNLTLAGDAYLEKVKEYTPDGRYSEQLHRISGVLLGARDLTWSYASFLTAFRARSSASFNYLKKNMFNVFSNLATSVSTLPGRFIHYIKGEKNPDDSPVRDESVSESAAAPETLVEPKEPADFSTSESDSSTSQLEDQLEAAAVSEPAEDQATVIRDELVFVSTPVVPAEAAAAALAFVEPATLLDRSATEQTTAPALDRDIDTRSIEDLEIVDVVKPALSEPTVTEPQFVELMQESALPQTAEPAPQPKPETSEIFHEVIRDITVSEPLKDGSVVVQEIVAEIRVEEDSENASATDAVAETVVETVVASVAAMIQEMRVDAAQAHETDDFANGLGATASKAEHDVKQLASPASEKLNLTFDEPIAEATTSAKLFEE